MPILHVRNVPVRLYARMQALAERNHRSLSAEILAQLESALEREARRAGQERMLADLDAVRGAMPPLPPGVDSSDWIREDRDGDDR